MCLSLEIYTQIKYFKVINASHVLLNSTLFTNITNPGFREENWSQISIDANINIETT